MKNKLFALGMAVLMLSILALSGCPTDADSGGTGLSLIGGKIGNTLKFFVNAVSGGSLSSVRSAAAGEPYPVEGQILYNGKYISLKGFYDPESMNFAFSGAAGNYAFEFFGIAKETDDGIALAAGKIKTKNTATGLWTEELVSFEFDSSILFHGSALKPAAGLPPEWTGIWECWSDGSEGAPFNGNAQLSEQFGTMQEGYMVLTPYSIAFWFDIEEEMKWFIEHAPLAEYPTPEGYTNPQEYIEGWRNQRLQLMANFSIIEVTDNGDGSYDVLTLSRDVVWSELNNEDTYVYRKLRFMRGEGDYSNELWIVFCILGGDGEEVNFWDTRTEDINAARTADNFIYDRENWGNNEAAEANITLFVARPR